MVSSRTSHTMALPSPWPEQTLRDDLAVPYRTFTTSLPSEATFQSTAGLGTLTAGRLAQRREWAMLLLVSPALSHTHHAWHYARFESTHSCRCWVHLTTHSNENKHPRAVLADEGDGRAGLAGHGVSLSSSNAT